MVTLENEMLLVQLYDRPGILGYTHKPTGARFAGDDGEGLLAINGQRIPWSDWNIGTAVDAERSQVTYTLRHATMGFGLTFRFALQQHSLLMTLAHIEEGDEAVNTVEWFDLPLVTCDDPSATYWRENWSQNDWGAPLGKGLYALNNEKRRIGHAIPDRATQPTVHACFFAGDLCCFVHSTYPYLPLLTRLGESAAVPERGSSFSVGLNRYQYHVRDKLAPPLQIRVVFLSDSNGDAVADECDYLLWLNRQFPDPDPRYRNSIWGKIDCATPGKVTTTFSQALELIEAIYHITDGMPQIVYLVGWQYDGHDTGYPSLDQLNPRLGGSAALLHLVQTARERYNCSVSYHINLDDSYREHPGWDERLICRDTDGSLISWEVFNGRMSYHISHTKDVESGAVFRRLKAMLDLVPVPDTIHLDAFRCSNCSWEADGFIGVMEELLCGVQPILTFFREQGIDVTTESLDRVPSEPAGLFSAVWHMYEPQLYHGKILGGGRGAGVLAFGVGTSTDYDIAHAQLEHDWASIVDQIYLGTILYQLYLTREMTALRWNVEAQEVMVRFGDVITAQIDLRNNRLHVAWGEVQVAENGDRFVPLHDAIYAYSTEGRERWWRLPPDWSGVPVQVHTLTRHGRVDPPPYRLERDRIWLRLQPREPVKIMKHPV